ncbi:MAG: hypothetical protein HYS13_20955 [Planctomycetia bacterium]|nr:hypothetical protein [Planctomycetia bacterium]
MDIHKLCPIVLVAAILPAQAAVAGPPADDDWQYSAVADDKSLGSPVFHPLRLETTRLENFTEKVAYRGWRRRTARYRR